MFKATLTILCACITLIATAQQKTAAGIWYAKPIDYTFKQFGTANIYTRSIVKSSPAKLVLNKNNTYLYQEIRGDDTLVTKGAYLLSGDTLLFVRNDTDSMKFFIYNLDKNQLIYSFYPSVKKQDQANGPFEPVEVSAFYKQGQDQFLKKLYQAISRMNITRESIALREYEILVLEDGTVRGDTFKALSEGDPYAGAVKSILISLSGDFRPALQNGRTVKSYWRFKLAY